jgi:hypothetical protein
MYPSAPKGLGNILGFMIILKPTPSGIATLACKSGTRILLMISVEVVNLVLNTSCYSSGDVLSPKTPVVDNPPVDPILFFLLERIAVGLELHIIFLLFVVWKTS